MKSFDLDFGKIIAYLLPGFVGLWGLSHHSQTIHRWLDITENSGGGLDKTSFVVLGTLATGVVLSAFRWIIFDMIIFKYMFKIPEGNYDFQKLGNNPDIQKAFALIVASHYNYYQFYSGMAVAIAFSHFAWLLSSKLGEIPPFYHLVTLITVLALGFSAAEALKKYEKRTSMILGTSKED